MIKYNYKEYNRVIVISDLHGCYEELCELLDLTEHNSNSDLLISVGDLIDRGPNSKNVCRLLRYIDAIVVQGNHENKIIKYYDRDMSGQKNNMRPYYNQDLETYNWLKQNPDYIEWMRTFPAYIKFQVQDQDYLVVHGGFFPHIDINKQDINTLCRLRYLDKDLKMIPYRKDKPLPEDAKFWDELWPGPEKVIYGHEARDEVKITNGCYSIDTSTVYGGKLTAMVINNDNKISFKQVQAQKAYAQK
jgi:bis(5'-nucleosyl)-tetraphosphatase (symmetrical)